jgi:hypothetical protein
MTPRTPFVRLLRGAAGATLLAGLMFVAGAPAAAAADQPSVVVEVSAADVIPESETGGVEDVRADSAASTKAVAGGAVLVVAGCISAVAVRPRRRPIDVDQPG